MAFFIFGFELYFFKVKIRQCVLKDLDQLVEIAKHTFVAAFEKDNDPNDFQEYIKVAFSDSNIEKELLNPGSTFYFVYSGDDLAGYFKLNELDAQTDVMSAKSIELERIYVLGEFQGRKIGTWVLLEVLKIASAKRKEFLWLGVWQKNRKAIKFYERNGFKKFGTHPYYIGKDQQTDWLMRFDLVTLGLK